MHTVSFAHQETGLFNGVHLATSDPTIIKLNTPPNHIAVSGHHDHLSRRVDFAKVEAQRAEYEALSDAEKRARLSVPYGVQTPEFRPTADVVVDYQPPAPSADHEWDSETKRWVLGAAAVARQDAARAAKARLVELDKQERSLLRRLVLDPTDTAARAALQTIEDEISKLEAL